MPVPGPPRFVFLEHLEVKPESRAGSEGRRFRPIGTWLVWYVTRVALNALENWDESSPILILNATSSSMRYYREAIGMEYRGLAPSAPGETLYGFRFSKSAAREFCCRHELQHGAP